MLSIVFGAWAAAGALSIWATVARPLLGALPVSVPAWAAIAATDSDLDAAASDRNLGEPNRRDVVGRWSEGGLLSLGGRRGAVGRIGTFYRDERKGCSQQKTEEAEP